MTDEPDAIGSDEFPPSCVDLVGALADPDRRAVIDHPHHRLDASRFWSCAYADFNKLQSDILRPRIGEQRFITTNFMPFHQDANPSTQNSPYTTYIDPFSVMRLARPSRVPRPRSAATRMNPPTTA